MRTIFPRLLALVLLSNVACKGSGTEPNPTDAPVEVRLWLPDSLGLTGFVEEGASVFAAERGWELVVVPDATPAHEIPLRIRELDAADFDYLVIPDTYALELAERGWITIDAHGFTVDDPALEAAASSVSFARLLPSPLEAQANSIDALDDASLADLQTALGEAFGAEGWKAGGISTGQNLGAEALTFALTQIAEKWGKETAGKAIPVLGQIYGVATSLESFWDYTQANLDVIDAQVEAYRSSADTVAAASRGISEDYRDLLDLKVRQANGEISAEDAIAEANRLAGSALLNAAVGRAAITEMDTAGHDTDLYNDMVDWGLQRFELEFRPLMRTWRAQPPTAPVQPVTDAVSVLQAGEQVDPDNSEVWQALATALVGYEPQSTFTHSNGVLWTFSLDAWDVVGVATVVLPDFSWTAACDGSTQTLRRGGFSGCFAGPGALPPGPTDWIAGAVVLDRPLDASPPGQVQHSFVTADGSPGDEYQASPSFPSDLWDSSDHQRELAFDGSSWAVRGLAGPDLTAQDTAARVVVHGETLLWMIPAAEIQPTPGAAFTGRATMFRHDGDYGLQGGDFDGDVTPAVGEALQEMPSVLLP